MPNNTLQLMRTPTSAIASGENVVFDVVSHQSPDILYDPATGGITFATTGRFIVNWWIATQASPTSEALFTLVSSAGDQIAGASGTKTGQITGSAIIEATVLPTQLSLVNTSSYPFYLPSGLPVTAGLTLFQDNEVEPDIACFAQQQAAHLISQLIDLYPAQTMTAFLERFATISSLSPLSLFTPPGTDGPGAVVFQQGSDYITIPVDMLTALFIGNDIVYNPSITYLPAPDPLPGGCAASQLAAIHAAAPVGSTVTVATGPNTTASGIVAQNHLGIIVLGDGSDPPLAPVFLFSPHIRYIGGAAPPALRQGREASGPKPPRMPVITQDIHNGAQHPDGRP